MATFRFTFPPSAAGLSYTIRDAGGDSVGTGTLGTSSDTQGPVVLVQTGLAANGSFEAEAVNPPTYYTSRARGVLDIPTTLQALSGDDGDAFSGSYNDLTDVPSEFPPADHTHSASDITSGTFTQARIPTLAQSKVTGLEAALDGKADTGDLFSGSYADLTNKPTIPTVPVAAHVADADPTDLTSLAASIDAVRDALVAAGLMSGA